MGVYLQKNNKVYHFLYCLCIMLGEYRSDLQVIAFWFYLEQHPNFFWNQGWIHIHFNKPYIKPLCFAGLCPVSFWCLLQAKEALLLISIRILPSECNVSFICPHRPSSWTPDLCSRLTNNFDFTSVLFVSLMVMQKVMQKSKKRKASDSQSKPNCI